MNLEINERSIVGPHNKTLKLPKKNKVIEPIMYVATCADNMIKIQKQTITYQVKSCAEILLNTIKKIR